MSTDLKYEQDPAHNFKKRTFTQSVCIGVGVAFVFLGAAGLLYPEIAGGHFSLTMNFLHLISGLLSFAAGTADKKVYAYWFCLIGVTFMGLMGLSGIIFGDPGYPSVGFTGQDPLLLVLIPRMIELGIVDHVINLALAVVFTLGIVSYRKLHHKRLFKISVSHRSKT